MAAPCQAPPGPGRLSIRCTSTGDVQVAALAGDLDLATAPIVERALRLLESTDPPVLAIDLRALRFIGSAGIALLLEARRRAAQRGRRLIVVRGSPAVQRVFEICGLADQLPFAAALPSAAAARSAAPAVVRRPSVRIRPSARAAARRRSEEAALAAAIRELRTHPRPDHRRPPTTHP
jgi:anti-sigma B factor antagonist